MAVSNLVAPLPAVRRVTSARAGLAREILGKGDPTLPVIPGWVSHPHKLQQQSAATAPPSHD